MKKGVLISLVVVLVLAATASLVWADPGTLYVDDDGICGDKLPCYTTIGAAMNVAGDGETILVFPGSYNEQVNVDKDVTVIGLGFPNVIGDPSGFFITAKGATVQRFRVRVPDGVGIIVAANDVTIRHNKITGGGPGTPANREAGIYVMANLNSGPAPSPALPDWPNPVPKWPTDEITGLMIKHNIVRRTTGPGIVLNRVATSTVARNRIRRISGDGIQVLSTRWEPSHQNIIERNTIRKVGGYGIKLVNVTDNTVQRNRVMKSSFDGIRAEDFLCGLVPPFSPPCTRDNTIKRNVMLRNGDGVTSFDAHDLTTGLGTANTANIWTKNTCRTDYPEDGLCK